MFVTSPTHWHQNKHERFAEVALGILNSYVKCLANSTKLKEVKPNAQ